MPEVWCYAQTCFSVVTHPRRCSQLFRSSSCLLNLICIGALDNILNVSMLRVTAVYECSTYGSKVRTQEETL